MVQARVHLPVQGPDKHSFRTLGLGAVAPTGAVVAAREPQLQPVRVAVDAAVKAGRVDEGLEQQQWMAEQVLPIGCDPPLEQSQHPRANIRPAAFGQDQKAAVVGDQLEPVVLGAQVPANPPVAHAAFERCRRQAHLRHPPPAPSGDVPQGFADLGQITQVVMAGHLLAIAPMLGARDRAQTQFCQGLALKKYHFHAPFLPQNRMLLQGYGLTVTVCSVEKYAEDKLALARRLSHLLYVPADLYYVKLFTLEPYSRYVSKFHRNQLQPIGVESDARFWRR